MIEIIFFLLVCIAISMFVVFGIETYIIVQEFIKLDKKSKTYYIKKSIPFLIIYSIFILIITGYIFKIIVDNSPY